VIKIDLTFWEAGEKLTALQRTFQQGWERVEGWISLPFDLQDVDNCPVSVLDIIAWQRDITRLSVEPEGLYRRRVKYAYVNARDAGSVAGFKRIMERLGVGYVEIDERQPDRDWDVITLRLSDDQLSTNPQLMPVIIQMYGRTCRRYEFEVITPISLAADVGHFAWEQETKVGSLIPAKTVIDTDLYFVPGYVDPDYVQ